MSKSINPKCLVGVGEAAKTLGLSIWTLRSWAYKGEVASHKLGNLLMFSADEIQRVIDESERPRVQSSLVRRRDRDPLEAA